LISRYLVYEDYANSTTVQPLNNLKYFIEIDDVTRSLRRIEEVRFGFWDLELLLAWILYSFAAAIVLFTFRVTKLKHWFMGIVGMGLWSILIALTTVLLNLNDGFLLLIFSIWVTTVIVGSILIISQKKKQLSGILYNWIFWVTPFIIPLIAAYIEFSTNNGCYYYSYNTEMANTFECSINKWISSHWLLINSVNILVVLVVIYFAFIPLARKWQSNPEE